MDPIAAFVQTQSTSLAQSVGTAIARQQAAAQRAVANLVAQTADTASASAPIGQGLIVDRRV